LLAVVIAVALAVTLGGGDDPANRTSKDRAATASATPSATASPEQSESGEADGTQATAPPPTEEGDDPSSPTGAVRAFYERAARDDFAGAFALAGPEMRSALGGSEESLASNLGSLRSIRFRTLTAEPATDAGTPVQVDTVARHTDRTDHCSGQLLAVDDGAGGYLVEPAGVSCTSS
jgi:hypothetical protein